jgi:hypothetical protein
LWKATPPALFLAGFFQDRVSGTICPGWFWTLILLICFLSSWDYRREYQLPAGWSVVFKSYSSDFQWPKKSFSTSKFKIFFLCFLLKVLWVEFYWGPQSLWRLFFC